MARKKKEEAQKTRQQLIEAAGDAANLLI